MGNNDLRLLQEADRHMTGTLHEAFNDEPTVKEMLAAIAYEEGIDASDWFGKYLVLQKVLSTMTKDDADEFMSDTLGMLDDEIKNTYEGVA